MKTLTLCALAMASLLALPAHAEDIPHKGLQELSDADLGQMRGRFTIGGNAVVWFGVTMASSWQTASGQTLQGTLTLGMDFTRGNTPRISFIPNVSISHADTIPDAAAQGRSVDGSGIANVQGLSQSVQVAGDGNFASNALQLNIRSGDTAPAGAGDGQPGTASAQAANASATAGFDGNAASLRLRIDGQGEVTQWLRSGSAGQSIQLMADGQQAQNRMQIDLIRQSAVSNLPLTQNVAASIHMARGISGTFGQ